MARVADRSVARVVTARTHWAQPPRFVPKWPRFVPNRREIWRSAQPQKVQICRRNADLLTLHGATHTREVAGSNPAAPIPKGPANHGVSVPGRASLDPYRGPLSHSFLLGSSLAGPGPRDTA